MIVILFNNHQIDNIIIHYKIYYYIYYIFNKKIKINTIYKNYILYKNKNYILYKNKNLFIYYIIF